MSTVTAESKPPLPSITTRLATALRTRAKVITASMFLFVVVVWVFYPSVHNSYVNYDDPDYLINNTHVQQGLNWTSVQWAFTATAASNWHPLTWISHMLDCDIFGPKLWGHHFTSVVLHGMNAVLVFLLIRVSTGSFWRSLMVASCFGLHPLRVESVTWLSERKDVLSACFAFAALLAYTSYCKEQVSPVTGEPKPALVRLRNFVASRRGGRYLLALFLFALSLLSKPMMVTLPCVMLLMDLWPLKRTHPAIWSRLALEKTPFFALSAILSVITVVVQRGAMVPMAGTTMAFRIENALISYARYLGKFFWPADLSPIYPVPSHWPTSLVAGAALLLLLLSVLFVCVRVKAPYALVGWLWFLGTLVPVIGLVAVGEQAMADRYTYFSLIGVTVVVVWGIESITRQWPNRHVVLGIAGIGVLAVGTVATRGQIKVWENSETLFDHTVAVTKNNYSAHLNFANALVDQGRLEEALTHNAEAARLQPERPETWNNMGVTLGKMGRFEAAIPLLHEAIRLNPSYADAHRNLAFTFLQSGRIEEAIQEYQMALNINPKQPGAHYMLGAIYANEGNHENAIPQFKMAIQLKPDYALAHESLAKVLALQGRQEEANLHFHEAARLNAAANRSQ